MRRTLIAGAAVSALFLAGCSSRPREFSAQLAAPPIDQAAFAASELRCRELAMTGTNNGKNVLASAGTGVAAGAGAAAIGTAAASGTYATMGGAMAAMGAIVVAAPVVGIAAAWGISKAKRSKKEGRIKDATATCLLEDGYEVTDWSKGRKVKRSDRRKAPVDAELAAR